MRKRVFFVVAITILTVSLTALAQKASRPGQARSAATRPVAVSKDTPGDLLARANAARAAVQDRLRYKGISVRPHPDAEGEALEAQRRVAGMLSRLDYVPALRIEHFRHLTAGGQQTITGWDAEIVDMAPAAGGFEVMMRVWPQFADGGFATSLHTIERYHLSNAGLSHISTVRAAVPSVSVWN